MQCCFYSGCTNAKMLGYNCQPGAALPCLLHGRHSTHSCPLTSNIRHMQSRPFHRPVTCSAVNSKRYAIIGAGLAGMSVAWHLLQEHQQAAPAVPVEVHVFEAHGIAAGGSGAAAGLLHPISPRGKTLWRGQEAFQAALELVAVAAAAASGSQGSDSSSSTIVWRHGMVRPAATAKQAKDFAKAASNGMQGSSDDHDSNSGFHGTQPASGLVHPLSAEQIQDLVPGIQVPFLQTKQLLGNSESSPKGLIQTHQQEVAIESVSGQAAATAGQPQVGMQSRPSRRRRRATAATETSTTAAVAGVHIPDGVVVDVHAYLSALWSACLHKAAGLAAGSAAVIHTRCIGSLQELMEQGRNMTMQQQQQQQQHVGEHSAPGGHHSERACSRQGQGSASSTSTSSWDAVVVAAGAAVGALPELAGILPLQICQGYTLVMQPINQHDAYPAGSPSILGSTYLSAQGSHQLVVGATKAWDVTPQQALQHGMQQERVPWSSNGSDAQPGADAAPAVSSACNLLLDSAAQVWPRVSAWGVREVRSGMRAVPPRTAQGSLPLLGRVSPCDDSTVSAATPSLQCSSDTPVYIIAGLGSRGMVYHALLGQQTARAIVNSDDSYIIPELTAWKTMAPDGTLRHGAGAQLPVVTVAAKRAPRGTRCLHLRYHDPA